LLSLDYLNEGFSYTCKLGYRIFCFFVWKDKEINNDRSFVNRNCLDTIGGDSKCSCNSVCESGGSTLGIEFIESPTKTNAGLDLIERFYSDLTASGKVKL